VWKFLKRLKLELPYDPASSLLGIYTKEIKSVCQRDILTPIVIAVLFPTAKMQTQCKCSSTEEWIKKMWYICRMEYYLALKKKQFLLFVTTWMNLENIMLCKISQAQKNEYCMIALTC
jgi:hypothetical protein